MKFLKGIVAMLVIFAMTSVNAKVMKKSTTTSTPAPKPAPYNRPMPVLPPLPELPTVDVKTKTFDPNYVENKVNTVVQAKGFAVKNESERMKKNRLIGLVKNEIIQDLTPETNSADMNALKHLVNTTMHSIIANDVERALMQYRPTDYKEVTLF